MKPNVTVAEVVRAQVALLFGKYRPAGGLTPEEASAMQAERVEFAKRLTDLVRGIDAPDAALIEQIRNVTRTVYSDDKLRNLPTVEGLCALVKRSFATRVRATCAGCAEMGGRYENASPDAPLLARVQGDIDYAEHGWLCIAHHHAVLWYQRRECLRRNVPGIAGLLPRFAYPPPEEILPRNGRPTQPPAEDPEWESFTDGASMGPTARWARAFVLRAYGYEVGATETPLLADVSDAPKSEAWRDL